MTMKLESKKWASDIAVKHGADLHDAHRLRMEKIKNGPPVIDMTAPRSHPLVKRRLMESIQLAKKIEKENKQLLFRLAAVYQKSCIDNNLSSHIEDYRSFTMNRIYRARMNRMQQTTRENRVLADRIINVKPCLSFK